MSTDPQAAQPQSRTAPGDPGWRAQVGVAQEAALPSAGSVLVTCSAPLGGGGLGRHMQEILDALDRRGLPRDYICEARGGAPAGDPTRELVIGRSRALAPLTRVSPAWRLWSQSVRFDSAAARRLSPAEHLIAFNGTALAQFRAAGRDGNPSTSLVSATAHMRHVIDQHAKAHRQYPLERPWAEHLLRRNLAEYARAERIYVSSRYAWDSFAAEGVREETLSMFPLTPHPRFAPDPGPSAPETFDVVYVGALTVDKGVPLLLDAFSALPHADMRLRLVGGWKTRGMRRHVSAACAHDSRISVAPGDPLELLRAAALYVHPTYSDGFAYAPAEAMACGVPVLVSEDTGMKELIEPGHDGLVLATGDLAALAEAIDAAYRREILAR
ncbi:MAG TPA: glycosyltransferase [Solirubrobacteraceae bacterium]|nr:glycosyltransferase [Solirubrobacteraceae bacterium]